MGCFIIVFFHFHNLFCPNLFHLLPLAEAHRGGIAGGHGRETVVGHTRDVVVNDWAHLRGADNRHLLSRPAGGGALAVRVVLVLIALGQGAGDVTELTLHINQFHRSPDGGIIAAKLVAVLKLTMIHHIAQRGCTLKHTLLVVALIIHWSVRSTSIHLIL